MGDGMNNAKVRLLVNRVVIGLAVLAILAGLVIFSQWGSVLINARLL
jgi:hypothetical protein